MAHVNEIYPIEELQVLEPDDLKICFEGIASLFDTDDMAPVFDNTKIMEKDIRRVDLLTPSPRPALPLDHSQDLPQPAPAPPRAVVMQHTQLTLATPTGLINTNLPSALSLQSLSSSFSETTTVTCPQPAPQPSVPSLPSYPLQDAVTDAPKNGGGKITARPRRSRAKGKTKVYEMGPQADPELEKKRVNAITAKLHRDKQRNEKKQLELQVLILTRERDGLRKLVEELKPCEANLKLVTSERDGLLKLVQELKRC